MNTWFLKTERGQLISRYTKQFRGKKDRHRKLGYPNSYGPRCKPGDRP